MRYKYTVYVTTGSDYQDSLWRGMWNSIINAFIQTWVYNHKNNSIVVKEKILDDIVKK